MDNFYELLDDFNFLTFLFILSLIGCSLRTMYNIKKYHPVEFMDTNIIVILIFLPIFEEYFFRTLMKYYYQEYNYSYILNAFLFGILHMFNSIHLNDFFLTFSHVFFATYMGYYLLQFDSFITGLMTHYLWNFIVYSIAYLYQKYIITNNTNDINQKNDKYFSEITFNFNPNETYKYISGVSNTDNIKKIKCIELKSFGTRYKFTPEIIEMNRKVYEIEQKRLEKRLEKNQIIKIENKQEELVENIFSNNNKKDS